MSILVLNAGSTSLKFGLFDELDPKPFASGSIDWTGSWEQAELIVRREGVEEIHSRVKVANHEDAVPQIAKVIVEPCTRKSTLAALGHRIVHGGETFRESTLLSASVKAGIARLSEVAPLHNPAALAVIQAAETAFPALPQVAVFDTAFFAALPPSAFIYPVPYEWYQEWGIRRFGFHGISHAYCAERATHLLNRPARDVRLVICHLGNGCSASAVNGGVALATSMGFTPLEGLMMGTRAGSIDPGVMLYVQRHRDVTLDQLDQTLNRRSGLLGISGISSDFRAVEDAARQGHERARLALRIYSDRIRATVGALAVTMGGVDALVFTAGVGEHSAGLRRDVCSGLECLGLRLDQLRNTQCHPDVDVATAESPGRILVIHTEEETCIARETRKVLASRPKP